MNFADLQNAWQSPHNQPSPAQLEIMKQQFIADHDRRRRGLKFFLFLVGSVLTVITLPLVVVAFTGGGDGNDFNASREWGSLALLALPWVGLILFARQLSRHDRQHGAETKTVADSVRALLDENRMSAARLRIVAALHGALLVLLPLIVYQLRAAGKAGDEILMPAFVGWPLISIGILLAMRWHYRTKLMPRKLELERLLKSYE